MILEIGRVPGGGMEVEVVKMGGGGYLKLGDNE